MTIKQIELFKVPPRWLFLRIETRSGIVGWGEPVVEGKADTVAACVKELAAGLIGRNAGNIEDAFQMMYRGGFYRGGPVLTSAISGIEQALWDIKGKKHGLPVYEFLGGRVRDRFPVYRWIGGDRPADVAQGAREAQAQGFTAVKMNATEGLGWIDSHQKLTAVVERVQAVQQATNNQLGVALDFHGRVHRAMAKQLLSLLAPLHPLFVEEPVLCENGDLFADLARRTDIPLAAGERNYTRWGFKQMLMDGGIDIVQPDVSHAGGIWEMRKIAAMAEAFDVALAPHCPLGPIALAACLQVDFCTPNAILQEQSAGIHYNTGHDLLDYLENPEVFQYRGGHVDLLTAPGLGIAINESFVRQQAAQGHDWHNPLWRDATGNILEW